MYYNTTNETGQELKQRHKKSQSQEDYIFELFKIHKAMTADDVCGMVMKKYEQEHIDFINDCMYVEPPPGSVKKETRKLIIKARCINTDVRRSITDLASAGKIEKSTEKRRGSSGRNNYVYFLI